MLYMDINGRPLLLPAAATAQVEHINPLFADGIEDSYSLPVEVPVEGNREALGHVQEADLTSRTLSFAPATLGHLGMPLFPGVLHVLGSTPRVVRTTFSIDGFVSKVRGKSLPSTMQGQVIDLVDDELVHGNDYRLRPLYANGGACQFPMHYNPKLYGDANPDWMPKHSEWSAASSYQVNDLVSFTYVDGIARTYIYQCVENTSIGESPKTAAGKWRKAAYGIVNAWDVAENTIKLNTEGNWYAQVPWFYVKWVLRQALAYFGYTPTGQFMEDEATHELVVPNATTLDASSAPSNVNSFRVKQSDLVYYDPEDPLAFCVPAELESGTGLSDPDNLWDNSAMHWVCPAAGTYRFLVRTSYNRAPEVPQVGTQRIYRVRFEVRDNTDAVRYTKQIPGIMGPVGNSSSTVEFSLTCAAGDVGNPFRFYFSHWYQWKQLDGTVVVEDQVQLWPTTAEDHYKDSVVAGWQQELVPELAKPDLIIEPHRHVPDVEVLDFLMAIADAYNLTLEPNETDRTLRMDYKQDVLSRMDHHREDHSHRAIGEAELDHQRAVKGVRLSWDIEKLDQPEENFENMQRCYSEQDLPAISTTGEECLVLSTRKVLKSVFKDMEFAWEQVGYHVPGKLTGESDGAMEVTPACKPLHMEELTLDGRTYIMPVMEDEGTSRWFHNESERKTIWLCHFAYATDASTDSVLVSGARSWAYNWGPEGTVVGDALPEQTLLWDSADANMPGMYQRHWELWARMLTTAEPVTRDLLVDLPYLTGRSWKGLHHIHGQDYLVEKLPVEYGGHRGQLVSRGAYLLRVKYPLLVRPLEQPAFDLCPTCHLVSPEAMCIEFADLGGSATIPPFSNTGHFTVIDAEGTSTTHSGTSASVAPGRYCIYPSASDGTPDGGYLTANEFGVGFNLFNLSSISGGVFNGTMVGVAFSALQMDAFVCPAVPSCGGFMIIISLCTTMDLTGVSIEGLVEFQLYGNPNVTTITVTGNFEAAYIRVILGDMPALSAASVDSIANRLDATKTGEVISYNTATPTAASQANRQALYDSGNWMLPDIWMEDLVL